ncbi:microtubule-associated tumor suppressor 1 homolog A isoform X2 [Genypterus blacodes]|uniref:microtubule-associated tumor suppressor 1 homolog A isoform X2 n=1 Tax=Genypterus blacodes TaxID=154954 RepID=UPI003F75B645
MLAVVRKIASQRTQAREEPTLGAPPLRAKIKLQVNGSRPPSTPSRPAPTGPASTPLSRLPRRNQGSSASLEGTGGTQAATGGAAYRSAQLKSVVLKARLITTPGRNTGTTLATACKPAAAAAISHGSAGSTLSPLKRAAASRLRYLTSSAPVDKSKPKAGSRQQQNQNQQASHPNQRNGPPDLVPAGVTEDYQAECRRTNQSLQLLRGLLGASHTRFEGLTIVLQQTLAERDEAKKRCRELSQELVNLRGELVCSVHSSERLEKEKDELRAALEEALQELQDQHQSDLAELEQRLQTFYQDEWDKVHVKYQEEADKCKTLMEQQMAELQISHETMKLELEVRHTEQLQSIRLQHQDSLEEMKNVHSQELESLDLSLKDTEAALSGQIEELTEENSALSEKLTAVESRRKELAERSQKDAQTLYLEQELESLKVVLDIKNKQLHQQEKKLMEIDKLTEKSVKLDESLKKVQQENEHLKARMERHAAMSRQLSTEQAVLQDSLHKESKVNKRLSMENEELMWKLHNGDLCSPRKVSPTSPSHSFNLQSPRTSALFSSPPVSPR